jgi:hypothetical protein
MAEVLVLRVGGQSVLAAAHDFFSSENSNLPTILRRILPGVVGLGSEDQVVADFSFSRLRKTNS